MTSIRKGEITGTKHRLKMVGFVDNGNAYFGVHECADLESKKRSALIYEQRLVGAVVHHFWSRWVSTQLATYALMRILQGQSHEAAALGTYVVNDGETPPWFLERFKTVSCGLGEMEEYQASAL